MSVRGTTAPKGSEGPRRMYAQGFTEQVQVSGVNEIGSHRVEAESILSLKLHLQSTGLI